MTRIRLLALALLFSPSMLRAQSASASATRVTGALRADAIWAPLRFLSSDLLEGRGTGARGGDVAAQYIASQFMLMGLEPAGDSGTYFHDVPIVTLVPDAQLHIVSGASVPALRYRDDFVMWSERSPDAPPRGQAAPAQVQEATGELVFVGYGIDAPAEHWDDYKGTDVRGKILLMLVNDPGLRNEAIFRGRILTYYGRWTYKLEEAARRGAAGVLLVHNDTMATYGWSTVRNSWTGDQVRLAKPATSLAWAGWIQQGTLQSLLAAKGLDLARLMDAAGRNDFRPVATGITVHGQVTSAVRFSRAANVVARIPGRDAALRNEAVVVTSHYDHLGIVQPVRGDSIMNGALDNASGTATILAIADAFMRSGVRPRRSIVFAALTGEEQGLLGSSAFAQRPPMPLASIAAVLNLDESNLYAATRDISVLGGDQSSLGGVFARAAAAERLRVTPDEAGLVKGEFFRSDHFPFARAGVPALSFKIGTDAVGHPAGWMQQQVEAYDNDRYHQPFDELLPWYTVDGALQQARVLIRAALAIGDASAPPTWNPSSEFRQAGEARRR